MTITELANIALSLLGARRIDNIDSDTTVEARSARIHFDLTFRSLLRRHQWSFGIARQDMALLPPIPAVPATATLGEANAAILATAKTPGTAGNALTAAIVIEPDSTALTVAETDGNVVVTAGDKHNEITPEAAATGFIIFTGGGEIGDKVTINGVDYTWTSTAPTGTREYTGSDASSQHSSLIANINGTQGFNNPPNADVVASPGGGGVLLTAITPGSAGNSITLAKTGTSPAVSGATLTGGADRVGSPATAAQAIALDQSALSVSLTLPGGTDGSASLAAVAQTSLSGGIDEIHPSRSTSREFPYIFDLPSDFVRLIRLATTDVHNPVREFEIAGKKLLTHAPEFQLVYISANCLDDLDDLFIDAFTLSLASKLAGDVTADPGLKQSFLTQLEQLHLPAAQNADAKEVKSGENFGPRALASMSGLVNARFRSDGRPPFYPTLP